MTETQLRNGGLTTIQKVAFIGLVLTSLLSYHGQKKKLTKTSNIELTQGLKKS